MYEFPVAAITNYLKLCNLRQRRFIIFQLEVVNLTRVFCWATIKVSNLFLGLFFQLMEMATFGGLWLHVTSASTVTSLNLGLLPPSWKYPCDYSGPTWRTQATLSTSGSLI